MSDNKLLLMPLALALIALLVGDALFVWPSARAAGIARGEIADFQPMLADLPVQTRIVESLVNEVQEKRRILGGTRDPRIVPSWSDEILNELRSVETGNGRTTPAVRIRSAAGDVVDGALSELDRAVTVDTVATFDSIFSLVRRVELMSEPVRLVRVRIDGPTADVARDAPLLAVSMDLELDGGSRREWETD